MAARNLIGIRVSKHELATMEALAESEMLPTGTFIRRFVLLEAKKRGIMVPTEKDSTVAVTE
jgi:hypothetical protein